MHSALFNFLKPFFDNNMTDVNNCSTFTKSVFIGKNLYDSQCFCCHSASLHSTQLKCCINTCKWAVSDSSLRC
jgi:hypothetical protein